MSDSRSDIGEAEPGPEAYFRARLAEGRFVLQRCVLCSKYVFYPRICCVHCGSDRLEWREASGGGTIYSTTVVRQKPEHGGDYNLALVELDEGPRMMSRVVGLPPQDVAIGLRVRARVEKADGQPLVTFERV